MVTLTIAAAMFTKYWQSSFSMTSAIFVLLLVLFLMNACGILVSSAASYASYQNETDHF